MRKANFISGLIKNLTIRFFNKLEPLNGLLQKKGYVIFKNKINISKCKSIDLNLISELVSIVINNHTIQKTIKDYICFPRLDQIRLLKSPRVKYTPQCEWHHDSVGHRIKIYIGLDEILNKNVYTEIVESSNFNSYFDYNITRLVLTEEEHLSKKIKCNIKLGDVFIFDTNMIHRGVYSKDEVRNVIELEFSSFFRGKIIPGKVGYKKNRERNLLDKRELTEKLILDKRSRDFLKHCFFF